MDGLLCIFVFSGWDSFLGQEEAGVSLQELLASDQHHLLDRSFTVRFRCLLDNTSGFLVCKPIHVSISFICYLSKRISHFTIDTFLETELDT